MKYIAFICGHNSARSQMAEGTFNYLKRLYPLIDTHYEALSWGTNPGAEVNPKILAPMLAIGIDMFDSRTYFPKTEDHSYVRQRLPHVVRAYTMGCMDGCPVFGRIAGDWALADPAHPDTDVVVVRDQILGKTLELLMGLDAKRYKLAPGQSGNDVSHLFGRRV